MAIDQACDRAQRFIDELRKNKPQVAASDSRMGDVRLLDAFLRQIPYPPQPDRPIGAIPLQGLGFGIVQSGDNSAPLRQNPVGLGSVEKGLKPLLNFIYSGEGGYDSYNRGRAGDSPGRWPGGLQKLTIAQIMELQDQNEIFAVGAAQFIPTTLPMALKETQLKGSDLFNAVNQDRLAVALLLGRKRPKLASYLKGDNNDLDAAQTDLAHEWASVPLPNGKGAFDGDSAGNKATKNVPEVRNALQLARSALMTININGPDIKVANVHINDAHHGTSQTVLKPKIKEFIQSPNCNSRGQGVSINTVVIHYTTGGLESAINTFKNPKEKVSAHYIIDKNGDIYQMVKDSDRAWHAEQANASSIGIEHVARDGDRLTDAQNSSSVQLIKWLISEYNITLANIKAHKQILPTSCPGTIFGDAVNDTILPKFKDWVAKNFSKSAAPSGQLGPSGLGLYIVQGGDTLSSIASLHDTSLEEILRINPDVNDPDKIFIGQQIIVARVDGDDLFISSNSRSLNLPVVISEQQLGPPTYQDFSHPLLGNVTITGGYMEPHLHSRKGPLKAIFLNEVLRTLEPSGRNIGIDYDVQDRKVKAWYGGVVTRAGNEGGYGRRVHVQLDIKFKYQGRPFTVFQAYAHLQQIQVSQGQKISQGQQIGVMGGSGASGDNDYPPHVDLSTYLFVEKEMVQLNPQALDRQLASGNLEKSQKSLT
ncbi:N-acetylmuramoyl-L-alanine amidase [Synechococcus sp. CS-1325]|uniref:N-acetylmuramoyl-L-alanine amidase n=1 Tax=Synechococcus sp. CS-1326 TaxID=2847978 RepID=UPI00223C22CB|nr:N-acetylmuramoyl-L-alanine amidase [Synechococcus sp. CS-1326]MCT0200484.1 N-acetylmuramoyl-L-alanine amidase [Synechococcus sp. CS-1325]